MGLFKTGLLLAFSVVAANIQLAASFRAKNPLAPRQRRGRPRKAGRTDYARRKAIVAPAFGQIKVRQVVGYLRLRGLAGAQGEWTLSPIEPRIYQLNEFMGKSKERLHHQVIICRNTAHCILNII
jgi:hypothetical protein